MTKNKIISAIIILALCVCVIMSLASCNTMNDSDDENTTSSAQTTANDTEGEANESTTADATDTEDAESTSAEDASSEGTSAEDASDTESSDVTSEETTEERFDYFSADLSKYGYVDSKEYESFEVSVGPEFEVTEEAVNAYIEQLCYNYRQATNGSTKVTNKPTKVGDVAYIFYKGVMDGAEFSGGSNMDEASPYGLTIGSGTFIPGFEEALVGVIPNETSPENMVEINLTFPENYGAQDLAGKDATFYVYISWIVEYTIPEYNESFVRDTLKFESDSEDIVAAHKTYITNCLVAEAESQIQALKESHIWNSLVESMVVTKYPEGEVDAYYDYYYTEVEYYYAYYTYMGMSFASMDDFACQFLGLESGADWKAEITKYAEDATKQTMVYHIVAKNEGIEITQEDVNKEIDAYIDYYKNYYGKDYTREEVLENMGEIAIKESALCTKVLDYLIVRVNVIYE